VEATVLVEAAAVDAAALVETTAPVDAAALVEAAGEAAALEAAAWVEATALVEVAAMVEAAALVEAASREATSVMECSAQRWLTEWRRFVDTTRCPCGRLLPAGWQCCWQHCGSLASYWHCMLGVLLLAPGAYCGGDGRPGVAAEEAGVAVQCSNGGDS
jgi:hypothetical protein